MKLFTDECKRLGEKDLDFKRISAEHELLLKDKERSDIKYSTLKREYKDLNDSLNQQTKKYEALKAKYNSLNEKVKALNVERENVEDLLKRMPIFFFFVNGIKRCKVVTYFVF